MRGQAFGLDLEGAFDAPGLWSEAASSQSRGTTLRIVRREAIEWGGRDADDGGGSAADDGGGSEADAGGGPGAIAGGRPRATADRLWTHRFGPGGPRLTLERLPDGYLMRVDGWGVYRVAGDGRTVDLAPPRIAPWRWQRLLTAQVLPLAALVQGLELLHASTVALGGRAVAIAGDGGAGKTTLAVHLALRGATIVTDDVLALEPSDGGVLAHPGPPLVNLRHDTASTIGPEGCARLGTVVGVDESALRLRVERARSALPLGVLYFLDRAGKPPAGAEPLPGAEPHPGIRFERIDPPDPRLLLGACFNPALRTPERLAAGLDLCSRLSHVPAFRLRASRTATPEELAAALEGHAEAGPW